MGKRLAGTLLAVVLLISFGAAYGEEYPVDVSGMKAAVLCSQDGQSIIEYNSAERLEVGGLGRSMGAERRVSCYHCAGHFAKWRDEPCHSGHVCGLPHPGCD